MSIWNKTKELLKRIYIIRRCVETLYTLYFSVNKEARKRDDLKQCSVYSVVSSNDYAKVFMELKPETIEHIPLSEVYGIFKGGELVRSNPKLDVMEVENAQIMVHSDMIFVDNACIWDKVFRQEFAVTIPCDSNLIRYAGGKVYVRKPQNIHKFDIVFSLCGVHSAAWEHFLLQYLPKLYILADIQKVINEEITIVMSEKMDSHERQLVEDFVSRFSNINIFYTKITDAIECKKLFYIEKMNYITEHSAFPGEMHWNFSSYTAQVLKENLFKYLNIEVRDRGQREKIYLSRRKTTNGRRLVNADEVEDFFIQQGFTPIIAHEITLEEKVDIFYNAAEIVGEGGSAFGNRIFSRPNTKVMMFGSYFACEGETLDGFIDKFWNQQSIVVAGASVDTVKVHGDYFIPLARIKAAYEGFFV